MPQQPQLDDPPAADPSAPDKISEAADQRQEWIEEEPLELPPRPRRRLLTPLPLTLLAVLLIACGFIGGVLVQKGQGGGASSSAGSGLASRFAALRAGAAGGASGSSGTAAAGGTGTGAAAAAGFAGLARGGSAGATAGQVAYLDGHTLYLTTAEGNTVKVNTSSATSVSKTVSSDVKAIHPGETVSVIGSPGANGTIDAETVRVGGAGGGLASLFGAAGAGGGSGSTTSSGSGAGSKGGSAPALFGNGG